MNVNALIAIVVLIILVILAVMLFNRADDNDRGDAREKERIVRVHTV